jgi:DNA repair protein RadC
MTELRLGGRRRWARLAFTCLNIELTFQKQEIEELMNVKGIGEKSFLKLKPLVTVGEARPAPKQ